MPPLRPRKAGNGYNATNLQSIEEVMEAFNAKHGSSGASMAYVPNSAGDGTGEIWIHRAPSRTNPKTMRTGKEYAPIRIKVDQAMLQGHHGEDTYLNVRGKLITPEYEYRASDPDASFTGNRLTSKDWVKRTSFDVLAGILDQSIGDSDKTRRDFGLRFGYLTDAFGSVGTRMSFKQLKERSDNRLNAIANTVAFRMPGSWDASDPRSQKGFANLLRQVGQRTGFIGGTSGIIGASEGVRSNVAMTPIKDLIGKNNVRQVTHFAYSAASYDPKTGKWRGPVDTGRVTTDGGLSYQAGYGKDPNNAADAESVRAKEAKRASLTQRQAYMPDDDPRIRVEKFQSGGKQRMNEIVIFAREGDEAGAGGSIASKSYMDLRTYEPEVNQEAYLPRGFNLSNAMFTGRSGSGRYSQSGGAIVTDQDLTRPGGRVVKVDRSGLKGVEIKNATQPRTVTDAAGNTTTRDFVAPEYRLSFGYDSDTIKMVSAFGLKKDTGGSYTQEELRKIFSPDTMTANVGGRWRYGVTAEEKQYHAEFQRLSKEIVERIQAQNQNVIVSLDPNQGGSTSGRTSIRWTQRKELDGVGGKGGSVKQTHRYSSLPDNPEAGGEVEQYLPVAQQQLARSVTGNRALERIVYEQDRKGNFVHNAPTPAQADEIDPATGLYKYRQMRQMSGRQLMEATERVDRIAQRERREANRNIAALHAQAVPTQVGESVVIQTGPLAGETATIEVMGKKLVPGGFTKKGAPRPDKEKDDGDYAIVRTSSGARVSYSLGILSGTPEIYNADAHTKIVEQRTRMSRANQAQSSARNLFSDNNPFGRWVQNRDNINATQINSEFLQRYVGDVAVLMGKGEQKSEQLFQQEALVGLFHTTDPRFQKAREAVRKEFGANDDDDINIWTSTLDPDRLNRAMGQALRVAPRLFKRGEHPMYQDANNPNRMNYFEAGLYAPHSSSGEWDLDNDTDGHIALVRATQGKSPEYTGLGRMTGEMLRMINDQSPELMQDIAATQTGRPNLIQAIRPELMGETVRLGPKNPLFIPAEEADDDERYDELLNSWREVLKDQNKPNSASITLPALRDGESPYVLPSPDVFIGQERSAIGRAYVRLLETEMRTSSVAERQEAREVYEAEKYAFFQQTETVKNALSINSGMITGFSRYVTDSSVGDNEVVIGDETVSLFAEQASKAAGFTVTNEDIIKALNSSEGMYGFAPRMPEVTGFVTPFKFRYDAKNKAVPMVSEYFAMMYMGDNDADPLMMMVMGQFQKQADGTISYGNFRKVKEMHDKAPSGYVQALARIQSGSDPQEFAVRFDQAQQTAQEIVDYKLDNDGYLRTDEQGRRTDDLQKRLIAARDAYRSGAGGAGEYLDLINKTTMEGLIRGASVRDSKGVVVPNAHGVPMEISPINVETGVIKDRRGNVIQGPKGQNVEVDRMDDLAKGIPSKIAKMLTGVKTHIFGAEKMSDVIEEQSAMSKGMGVYTYLMSMASFFDDKHKQAIQGAADQHDIERIEKFASEADRNKGGLGQYGKWSSLAREGILYEYQRAIDYNKADPRMERASKEFFTTDISDWNRKRADIVHNAAESLVFNTNMNAMTAAALMGQDEKGINQLYQDIRTARAGMYSPMGSPEQIATTEAFSRIKTTFMNSQESPWMQAMRGRVLINTQERINDGTYEQKKTVAERRQIKNEYYDFLKYNPTAEREAMRIAPLSRMMDSGRAIASAVLGYMGDVAQATGFNAKGIRDLEKSFRAGLGGKSIEDMSMKPGEADEKAILNASTVNSNGVSVTKRDVAKNYPGIHSSYSFTPEVVTDAAAEKTIRMLGGNKKQGEDFTPEELRALPISSSQVHYLADPQGDAHQQEKSGGKGLEGEYGIHSSGTGLVNTIISAMFAQGVAGDASREFGSRGMYEAGVAAFERGKYLEEEVFREARASGKNSTETIGFRTKGAAFSKMFGAVLDPNTGQYSDAASISYEPDLLVKKKDASGNTIGWQVKDIKTTSRAADGSLYIEEEGQWVDGELPGGYVVQQMHYVQGMNDLSEGIRQRVVKTLGFGKSATGSVGMTLGDYMLGVAEGTIDIQNAGRLGASLAQDSDVKNMALQYKRMHEWFMGEDNNLTSDQAHAEMKSLITHGVEAGGLIFNVTSRDSDGKIVLDRDATTNELIMQDYDSVYGKAKTGKETGFEKLRGMTRGQIRDVVKQIDKAASDNRLVRAARHVASTLAVDEEANVRWNRDRAQALQEVSGIATQFNLTGGAGAPAPAKRGRGKKATAPAPGAPQMTNQRMNEMARELAGTLPYLRSRDAERGNKPGVTMSGLARAEKELVNQGILDPSDPNASRLSAITGKTYKTADDAARARIDFRKLVGTAARQGKEMDVDNNRYVEVSDAIARFMGGQDREKNLAYLQSIGVFSATDLQAFNRGPGNTLADANDVTARQMHQLMTQKYGMSTGNMMNEGGRMLINPMQMHPSDPSKDVEKQEAWMMRGRRLLGSLLKIVEGKQAIVDSHNAGGSAAQVVDDRGNPISNDTSMQGQTVESMMSAVRAGQISSITPSQYTNIEIPTFASASPAQIGTSGAKYVPEDQSAPTDAFNEFQRVSLLMQSALSEVDPELAKKFQGASATELPALMQQAFAAIGSPKNYEESGAGRFVPYARANENYNLAAQIMAGPQAIGFYSGLSDQRPLEYIPPQMGDKGEVMFRSAPIQASAPAATINPTVTSTGGTGTTGGSGGTTGGAKPKPFKSAVDQSSGRVNLRSLNNYAGFSLTAEERAAVHKHNQYLDQTAAGKVGTKLTPKERAVHDAALQKIAAHEATIVSGAPAPAAATGGGGGGGTGGGGGGGTGGGGSTTIGPTPPPQPAPSRPVGTIGTNGEIHVDRFAASADVITSYLSKYTATDQGGSFVYSGGVAVSEIHRMIQNVGGSGATSTGSRVGMGEVNLMNNLNQVFNALRNGQTVSATAVNEARKQLFALQDYVATQTTEAWQAAKPALSAEIQRVAQVLEDHGAGNTRAARQAAAMQQQAMAVGAAKGIAATAPKGKPGVSAPVPLLRTEPTPITTTAAEISSIENIERRIKQLDPTNTDNIAQGIRSVFDNSPDAKSAWRYNQSGVYGNQASDRLRLQRALGFDPSKPEDTVASESGWVRAVEASKREQDIIVGHIKTVDALYSSVKNSYEKSGKKFEDDPDVKQWMDRLQNMKSNLVQMREGHGNLGQLQHDVAMAKATNEVNNLDASTQIAGTYDIVKREVATGVLAVPVGRNQEDFINEEVMNRVNTPGHAGAKGAGLTADQRAEALDIEYRSALAQLKNGKADISGFFKGIRGFTEELKKSTDGWVKTLSAEGQASVQKFIKASEDASKSLEDFVGMSYQDRQDPKKAADQLQRMASARRDLAKETADLEANAALKNDEKTKDIITRNKVQMQQMDSILAGKGDGSLAASASKELGKDRVDAILDEAGVDRSSGESKSKAKRNPMISLLGAHAAYQIFMAAKAGIDPFKEAVGVFENSRMSTNSILSGIGMAGARSDTIAGMAEEARNSAKFRRGREASRFGLMTGFDNSGAFQIAKDVFDPMKGAGIALVPMSETITNWAENNRKEGGWLKTLGDRASARSKLAETAVNAAKAAGKSNLYESIAGGLSGMVAGIAQAPTLPLILGGVALAGIASVTSNLIAAGQDQQGKAIASEIATRRGGMAAFDASPWSAIVSGGSYSSGTEFSLTTGYGKTADTIRKAAIAADTFGVNRVNAGAPQISLTSPKEMRAFLEYAALAGDWRNYAKGLGVDSGSQQEAQALAAAGLGGIKTGDEFDRVSMRLIRAQSSGEGAANVLGRGEAMARAAGYSGVFEGARRYATVVDEPGGLTEEKRKEYNELSYKAKRLNDEIEFLKKPTPMGANAPDGTFGSGAADAFKYLVTIPQKQEEINVIQKQIEDLFKREKFTESQSKTFLSNYEKTGGGDDLDKAASQAGFARPGEIRSALESMQTKLALNNRALTAREGGIIASEMAGNKLFEQSMLGMNAGAAGVANMRRIVGPMDYTSVYGNVYGEYTAAQKEVGSQLVSYGESIRNMRMQSGMSYDTNVNNYFSNVTALRDNNGRAYGLDRASMEANTYMQFGKNAIERATEIYGIQSKPGFANTEEIADTLGIERKVLPRTAVRAMDFADPSMQSPGQYLGGGVVLAKGDPIEYLDSYQQNVITEVTKSLGALEVASKMAGVDVGDLQQLGKAQIKKMKDGTIAIDPIAASNIATRTEMVSSGMERRANAFGFSNKLLNALTSSTDSALPMQMIAGIAGGDPTAITQALYNLPEMNRMTGGKFGAMVEQYGLSPLVDVSTGAPIFERSMVGMRNPFTGGLTSKQSEITPSMIKASLDPMRTQLFKTSAAKLNGATYNRVNQAMVGYEYTNPNTGEKKTIGGVAGLQLLSNQMSYEASMASIGISREQLEYNRMHQLTWEFPMQETQNRISTAQALGGMVHTQWMKDNGIGPLDFTGGKVTTEGMDGTVEYQGGQIGQQKFSLAMSKIEAKRGYEQSMARMGWQIEDMTREIGRSRIRGGWQRDDFALQEEQMQFGRQKQMYDFSYQAREMGISRQQFREDVDFQQRQRQLQFGWQMEDADISIRRSTGFDRKQLIKNKEREIISFNMETEQVNRQNTRQEEAFKREEEKFNKEIEHYQKSLKFEDEQFSRQKKRFEQQREWEEEDFAIKVGRVQQEAAWATESYQRSLAKIAVEEDILKKQEANEVTMDGWRQRQFEKEKEHAEKMYELSLKSLAASAASVENQKIIQDNLVILNQEQQDATQAITKLFQDVDWSKFSEAMDRVLKIIETVIGPTEKPSGGKGPDDRTEDRPKKVMANGGKANRGESYLVGEHGAEILNIGNDGTPYILPNSAIPKDRSISRAGQGEVIHIHVMMDSDEIATYTAGKANNMATRNRRRAFNG